MSLNWETDFTTKVSERRQYLRHCGRWAFKLSCKTGRRNRGSPWASPGHHFRPLDFQAESRARGLRPWPGLESRGANDRYRAPLLRRMTLMVSNKICRSKKGDKYLV